MSRHQIVTTRRLFTIIKGQNLFEVQAFFFVLKHFNDRTGKNGKYLILHNLTKVFASTKMMRKMAVICSRLPLENTSYNLSYLMIFQVSLFHMVAKWQAKVEVATIAISRDYRLFSTLSCSPNHMQPWTCTVKPLKRICCETSQDIAGEDQAIWWRHLNLLNIRNVPRDTILPSPAQRLMSRATKNHVYTEWWQTLGT